MPARLPSLLLALAVGAATPARAAMETFRIDPDHFSIGFFVMHLGYERVLGMFQRASGSFELDDDAEKAQNIRVEIEAASVTTGHRERDRHLVGGDFFNAREFPKIGFVGGAVEKAGLNRARVTGELTLLGRKRPVVVEVSLNKIANYPMEHRRKTVGISARAKIKRSDFGMSYGLDNGLVGDDVELVFEFEANRQ